MSEQEHTREQQFAPEISIGSVSFENYHPHLANRSVAVLREELSHALEPSSALQKLATLSKMKPLSLQLNEQDFSSPERLGKALARSILKQVGL